MGKNFRFNGLMMAIVIILVIASAVLLLPSRRQTREKKLLSDLAKQTTMGSEQDIVALEKSHQFVIASKLPKKGSLYLFVPSLNNNIAVLSSPGSRSFLSGFFSDVDVHVVPVSDPQSPTTNLAMKLALLTPGRTGQTFIDEVASNPVGSKAKIEDAWNKLPKDTKTKLNGEIESNLTFRTKAGKYMAILQYQSYVVKAESWNDLQIPNQLLHEFYQ